MMKSVDRAGWSVYDHFPRRTTTMKWDYAAIAVVFGKCADRYVIQGYTEDRTFDQMLADAKKEIGRASCRERV